MEIVTEEMLWPTSPNPIRNPITPAPAVRQATHAAPISTTPTPAASEKARADALSGNETPVQTLAGIVVRLLDRMDRLERRLDAADARDVFKGTVGE